MTLDSTTNHEKRTPLYAVFERYPYSDPERLLGIFSTHERAKTFIESKDLGGKWNDEDWYYVEYHKETIHKMQVDYEIELYELDSEIVG